MKKTLLFASILATTFCFSQKLMNSTVQKNYDEFGNIDYIDSNSYIYSSFQGSFNEFKPKFGYDDAIFSFLIEDFKVHSNVIENYQGFMYPLALAGIDSNTIANDLISIIFNSGWNQKTYYTYNSQGKETSKVTQSFNGTDWITYDSTLFNYDVLGNLTVETSYSNGVNSLELSYVDSLFYQMGTSNLSRSINYYFDGVDLLPYSQSLVYWTGNSISYLDLYEGDVNGALSLVYRLYYSYTGLLIDGFEAFEVTNGAPNPALFAEGFFTYNAQNNPETYKVIVDGETNENIKYIYDADEFLIGEEISEEDSNGDLYVYEFRNYYFTNLAAVNEVENLDVIVYPNPTSDILKIQSTDLIKQIQVFNMNGQIVLSQNNKTEVDVRHLPAGNYIIYGQSASKEFKQSFVKQ